ncbi:MAG: hypothetical protein Q8N47_03180 [Bryobacterales bacterium]|nr:hypothetical protein [Bryobacterales bacterium]
MAQAFAEFEGGGEALAGKFALAEPQVGKFALAEPQVGEAAEVETVRLPPGVLAVRVLGAVERVAGVLKGFARIAGGEVGFGQGEADVDRVLPEAAGVRQEDAGFALGDGLMEIAEVPVEFAGGVERAELEFDISGAAGEGAGFCQGRKPGALSQGPLSHFQS